MKAMEHSYFHDDNANAQNYRPCIISALVSVLLSAATTTTSTINTTTTWLEPIVQNGGNISVDCLHDPGTVIFLGGHTSPQLS